MNCFELMVLILLSYYVFEAFSIHAVVMSFLSVNTNTTDKSQDIEHQLFVMNHLRKGWTPAETCILLHFWWDPCTPGLFWQHSMAPCESFGRRSRTVEFPTNYPHPSASGSLMVEQIGRSSRWTRPEDCRD